MSLITVGCLNAPAKSAPATVKLTTEPALSKIVPYEAEATTPQQSFKLTLQAIDPTGKPLTNVSKLQESPRRYFRNFQDG